MIYNNTQIIELVTKDKLVLPGILFAPKKTKKAVIYLHGNGSSSVFYSMEKLSGTAQCLNEAGFAYLAFNNRGAHAYHKVRKFGSAKKMLGGTSYELIKDCIKDIDAAVEFLKSQGYTELYLMGFSTGANKICVYNYYKPQNNFVGYIIVAGGDDMGIYYGQLGAKKFSQLLKKSRAMVASGKGAELMHEVPGLVYSYRSFFDICNPDGDYNNFPYLEYFKDLKLSSKKLFRHFASIKKRSLVIYGDRDEYSWRPVKKALDVLKLHASDAALFTFSLMKGADHGFTGKEREFNKEVVKWLLSH